MRKALTFDCYGTLLDTSPLKTAISRVASGLGIDGRTASETYSGYEDRLMYGGPFRPYETLIRETLAYCDMELDTSGLEAAWGTVLQAHRTLKPFPDVLDTLHLLKAQGYELYLMSNTSQELMDMHRTALGGLFDDALVADETRCYKPDLRFFREAARRFHLGSASHCHIAKGYWWDIVPCAALGWSKIWVNRAGMRGRDAQQPYREIPTLKELPETLQDVLLDS